jgi:hypothetical protein
LTKKNKLSYRKAGIGYELTGDIYFKYQKPDKTIVDWAETETFPPYEDISHLLIDSMDTLCYSPASGTQYIFKNSYITGTARPSEERALTRVNILKIS